MSRNSDMGVIWVDSYTRTVKPIIGLKPETNISQKNSKWHNYLLSYHHRYVKEISVFIKLRYWNHLNTVENYKDDRRMLSILKTDKLSVPYGDEKKTREKNEISFIP